MKKIFALFAVILVSMYAQAVYACGGKVVYSSGKQVYDDVGIYNIMGQLLTYTTLGGEFFISSCSENMMILVRDPDQISAKAVISPNKQTLVTLNDGYGPDPSCDGSCPGCTTTDFEDIAGFPGYQKRGIGSCNHATCVCSWTYEYRCAAGYHGQTTDGQTGCYACGGFIRDITGTGLGGAKIYDIEGKLVSQSTSPNGEFGISCESALLSLYVINYNNQSGKLLLVAPGTTPSEIPVGAKVIEMSNDIQITLCTQDVTTDAGYYCAGNIYMICPADENGMPVTSDSGNDRGVTGCYVSSSATKSDSKGIYSYSQNCHYSTK